MFKSNLFAANHFAPNHFSHAAGIIVIAAVKKLRGFMANMGKMGIR